MGKEIERRFLLKKGYSVPIPNNFVKCKIKQGYLAAEKGQQIRVRISKYQTVSICKICVKFTGKIIRDEFEYDIPNKDGKLMFDKCKWTLEKNRVSFNIGNAHFDMDNYPNGLVTVEVEFNSIKHMEKWVKPEWLGEEITGVDKYSNILLAKKNLKFK